MTDNHNINNSIALHRQEIDRIDSQLLELLGSRLEQSLEIRALKQKLDIEVLDKKREDEVVSRLCQLNSSKFSDKDICQIFYLIMKLSREVK